MEVISITSLDRHGYPQEEESFGGRIANEFTFRDYHSFNDTGNEYCKWDEIMI